MTWVLGSSPRMTKKNNNLGPGVKPQDDKVEGGGEKPQDDEEEGAEKPQNDKEEGAFLSGV